MNQPWHVLAPTSGDERWTQLAEMVASGELLLHGSQTPGLRELAPRAPLDFSLDEYSKRTAIYATEDPTWASTETVPVVTEVPVTPQNLPITPLFHDFDAVAARAQQNPEGFPWLDDPGAKRGV